MFDFLVIFTDKVKVDFFRLGFGIYSVNYRKTKTHDRDSL